MGETLMRRMQRNRLVRSMGALTAGLIGLCATSAQAAYVVEFDNPHSGEVYGYSDLGMKFGSTSTSSRFDYLDSSMPTGADPDGRTMSPRYSSTPVLVTREDNGVFDLISIDLADPSNNVFHDPRLNPGSDVKFFFDYANGSTEEQTVTLDKLAGLETFTFNRTGLTRVIFYGWTTHGRSMQFDNATFGGLAPGPVVPAHIPEPTTWALMLSGFGLLGAALRARQRGSRRSVGQLLRLPG